MAAIIKAGLRGYFTLFHDMRDPRSDDMFLMYSVWQPVSILVVYLYFVLALGPSLMKKKPPMKLDLIIKIYDLVQIFICLYIIERSMTLGWAAHYQWFCQPVDYSDSPIAIQTIRAVWCYMMLKFLDLFDTVFFVLRKKQTHVTFLHVYHHAGIFFGAWIITKFLPGGHGTFLGWINSLVHIAMYSYYFVCLQWPETRKNIWWKKYVTQLQIVQFFFITLHNIPPLFLQECNYPRGIAAIMVMQYGYFMFLFIDFYKRNYSRKKTS